MVSSRNGAPAKLAAVWSPRAQKSLQETLAHVRQQAPGVEALILRRLKRALAAIVDHPDIGTPLPGTALRYFVVPQTGHVLYYRVLGSDLLITKWVRQRRNRKP